MNLSVIIPAFNAEETISAAIDSVLAQSSDNWEIIVIDDGSTDGTASLVEEYCRRDKRIRLFRQNNKGLSEARNAGIEKAGFDHLLFLDADDWIADQFIEKMGSEFSAEPAPDAVICGWQFVLEDGRVADKKFPPFDPDMFPHLTRTCPFVVHACVINKRMLNKTGNFDSRVGYVEDWDFWQRVARVGAKFGFVREVLAFYRMRKGSLSRKTKESYRDAKRMVYQGYAADPRLSESLEQYRQGLNDGRLQQHLCWLYWWYISLSLGLSREDEISPGQDCKDFNPDPEELAAFIFEGVYRGGCFLPQEWYEFYLKNHGKIRKLLDSLDLSVRDESELVLCRMIAEKTDNGKKVMIGNVLFLPIEILEPLENVEAKATMVVVAANLKTQELGRLALDPRQSVLDKNDLKIAIADQWSWQVMTCYLQEKNPQYSLEELEGGIGWELFLQEFWGLKWPEAAFYDVSYFDEQVYQTRPGAGLMRVETSDELFNIEWENGTITIQYFVGGLEAGKVLLDPIDGKISAQMIRASISTDSRFELCRLAVIQAVIGKPGIDGLLRERLRAASKLAE